MYMNSLRRRVIRTAMTTRPFFWQSSSPTRNTTNPTSSFLSQFFLDGIWNTHPKVPRGFEEFIPKDPVKSPRQSEPSATAKNDTDSSAAGTAKNDTTSSGTSGPAVHPTKDQNNSKRQNNNNNNNIPPSSDDDTNLPGLVALLMLVLAIRQFLDLDEEQGSSSGGIEITFVEFRDKLLSQTEKLQVINQNLVKVILKPQPHQQQPHFDSTTHVNPSTTNNNAIDSTESIQYDSSSSSSSSLVSSINNNNNRHHPPHFYYFYIGSVESFEEKMARAQQGRRPEEWTEIQYISYTNWGLELMKFVPALAFMAAIYFGTKGIRTAATGGSGGSGGRGIFGIGKSNAKEIKPQDVTVKFKDVAGCDEAKREIMEFVDFLKDSSRFTKLGAKIPKGALLCGPPGTGKTLLAKATAGEAGVPFFSISGSDFIEMFVGVGPSRVRDLFKEARRKAPCIVFIDEIDAVGRQRGRGGFAGGNDERENTLNQLLVEMDGFSPTTGVVVLAGTNRVDILDEALTRPGRFDRQVQVDKPDLKGRKEIFKVHLDGIKLEGNVEDYAGRLAGLTPGFAGADIANICNEAAIVAARRKATSVSVADFEKATDRIIGGLESHKIMSPEEKSVVAYHEAGHAVAGWFLEHTDPLLKVTIIPRSSGALGFAQYLPKEVFLRSHEQIMDIVCMALAGRASEEVFFGRVTTGAADDLRRVTQLVYSTIKDFGMNDKVGQLSFPQDEQQLGDKPYSDSTAEAMDDEARSIVDAAYQRTIALIRKHKEETEKVAKLLLEKETITHDDIIDLVGPRPFVADKAYQEYVSSRKIGKEEEHEKQVNEDDLVNSGLTPGLA